MFKCLKNTPGKDIKSISSRSICLLYEGRKGKSFNNLEFKDYKGLIRRGM